MEKYIIEELKGKMFGFLEVISEAKRKGKYRFLTCKCHRCGRIKDINLHSVTHGITTSCGCGHRNNLIGRRFGHLVVVDYSLSKNGKTFWKCKCDCGTTKDVGADGLVKGAIQTCGCCSEKSGVHNHNYKHGLTHSRIMRIWTNMKGRCYNPREKAYKNYGARGITICSEWINDVKSFYDWAILNGYDDTLTIDRIDVNGNYEPSNCRWVDRKTQCNNQRNNHLIEYKGERLTISQISDKTKIPSHVISNRIYSGMSEKEAVETLYKKRGKYKTKS